MTQEAEIKPIVQMTETAARELKEYLGKQGKPSAGLRVFVTAGGCSGLSYGMVPDERITEDDYVIEAYGAKVIVDKSSAPFIAGWIVPSAGVERGTALANPAPDDHLVTSPDSRVLISSRRSICGTRGCPTV